ncbi:MAG: hypothetical protein J7L44_04560, partial [Candidatus Diapherotrites archaeon]|nr:hypothetical protein [Candidatus Diapherotrites archaeon]
LLLISMLQDKKLPDYVAMTGQIAEDGSIGSVGGVFLKAEKAHETGIKLFMIPKGDAYQTHRFPDGIKTVNLVEYAPKNWGMIVVEVSNIDEALKYAFMDLNSIDINKQIQEQEPFVPDKIPLKEKFMPIKELTARYIRDAEDEIKEAKEALNDMPVSGRELMSTLLESLTNSQKLVSDANMLYEVNYLYSAANSAFIAKINARFVKDIAKNPSLLKTGSMALAMWKEQLRTNIKKLKKLLDSFYTAERLEWLIAAKQRVSWAEVSLNNMQNMANPVDRLQAYEFALGWYEIASDFYNIAVEASDKFHAKPELEKMAKEYLIEAENCEALLTEEDEDVKRRIDAARLELEQGWYDAAILDAASATGLCYARTAMEGKKPTTLVKELERRLSTLKEKLKSDETSIWAELYSVHAEYFLKSAKHLMKTGAKAKATEEAKTALSLTSFAEKILNATNKVKAALARAERKPLVIKLPKIEPNAMPLAKVGERQAAFYAKYMPLLLASISGLLVVALGLVLIRHTYPYRAHPEKKRMQRRMAEIEQAIRELDRKHLKGRLSHADYLERRKMYEEQLRALKEELSRRSKQLLEIDRLRGEMKEMRFILDQLRAQYASGDLLEEDYKKAIAEYSAKLEKIKEALATKEQSLEKETKPKAKRRKQPKSKRARKPRKKTKGEGR